MSNSIPPSRDFQDLAMNYEALIRLTAPSMMMAGLKPVSYKNDSKKDFCPVTWSRGDGAVVGYGGEIWSPYIISPFAKYGTFEQLYNTNMGSVVGAVVSGNDGEQLIPTDIYARTISRPPETASAIPFWNGCQSVDVDKMYDWAVDHKFDYVGARLWSDLNTDGNKAASRSHPLRIDGNAGIGISNIFICKENKKILQCNDYHTSYPGYEGIIWATDNNWNSYGFPLTINTMLAFAEEDPSRWRTCDTTVGGMQEAEQDYSINPHPPSRYTDFMVSTEFHTTLDPNLGTTTGIIRFNVPTMVSLFNPCGRRIRVSFKTHAYNWWFSKISTNRYNRAEECRHPWAFGTSLSSEDDALNFMVAHGGGYGQNPTYYDFGLGLKPPGQWNSVDIEPFGRHDLVIKTEDLIWGGCPGIDEDFRFWEQAYKWVYDNGQWKSYMATNPMQAGCYGFWIDWAETAINLLG